MKITHKKIGNEDILSLQEIYCNTVLETKEGNQVAVCMRDDTIEFNVIKHNKWYRINMQNGEVERLTNEPKKD